MIPETVGNPPCPRFGHTALFLRDKAYYMIYGGRNDGLYETLGKSVLSDIYILKLKSMAWCRVKLGRYNPGPRYFQLSMYEGKLNFSHLNFRPKK